MSQCQLLLHGDSLPATGAVGGGLAISGAEVAGGAHAARPRVELGLREHSPLRLPLPLALLVHEVSTGRDVLVLRKRPGSQALVTRWLLACCQPLVRETVTLVSLSPHELTN